jgi:predicted alternative tryptophan synthase beta-subunit
MALPDRHRVWRWPALPQKWFRVPNGTPPELERCVDNPEGLKEHVQDVLSRAQQFQDVPIELIEVYFEVGRPVAHVLVRNLDDPITVKAVCRILHAEGSTELLTADQVRSAIERERAIEPEPDSTSTS